MDDWSDWIDIEIAQSKRGLFNHLGIYQIRAVTFFGGPIPINRLAGVDNLGVLYIGRSGYTPNRSIANRIREFVGGRQHSGGITYARAKKILDTIPQFSGHQLQVRARFLLVEEIATAESSILHDYFSKYGELPPCNSATPTIIKND